MKSGLNLDTDKYMNLKDTHTEKPELVNYPLHYKHRKFAVNSNPLSSNNYPTF